MVVVVLVDIDIELNEVMSMISELGERIRSETGEKEGNGEILGKLSCLFFAFLYEWVRVW